MPILQVHYNDVKAQRTVSSWWIASLILYAAAKNINKSSTVAEMSDRLTTIDMGRKVGVFCPFQGELGLHPTQCGRGRGLPPC